jgi:biopolymer transport protein ExbD
MQMTPMIDMTFLLLIFFMVTSKLSKEQVKMDIALPVASAAVVPSDVSNRDIINIDGEGRFFVGDREVGADDLRSYLAERFRNHPPLRLYVRADRSMRYARAAELMEMAAAAGATDVIFGTLKN